MSRLKVCLRDDNLYIVCTHIKLCVCVRFMFYSFTILWLHYTVQQIYCVSCAQIRMENVGPFTWNAVNSLRNFVYVNSLLPFHDNFVVLLFTPIFHESMKYFRFFGDSSSFREVSTFLESVCENFAWTVSSIHERFFFP